MFICQAWARNIIIIMAGYNVSYQKLS